MVLVCSTLPNPPVTDASHAVCSLENWPRCSMHPKRSSLGKLVVPVAPVVTAEVLPVAECQISVDSPRSAEYSAAIPAIATFPGAVIVMTVVALAVTGNMKLKV